MKDTNDFGTRLEKLCKEKGITPSELARRISLSRKSIFEWVGKSGRIPRDPLHLKKLCEFFEVSPAWLIWGEEEKVSTIESLISKTDLHVGMYEISIKKIDPRSKKE